MNKLISRYCAFLLLTMYVCQLPAYMQPIKEDGLYYYSEDDTYKHIDFNRAVKFLAYKMLSPKQLIKNIVSFFYSSEPTTDPVALLNPTQMIPESSSIEPKIVWIGYATFLIQINGFNILTDPIFGHVKVGPLSLTKRVMPAGIRLEDLPPIDAIVISHNHSDHTDTDALTALCNMYDPVIFVPEGNGELAQSMGFSNVVENTWWDENTLTKDNRTITFTCLPAYHWSIRFSLGSYRQSLWSSWMISSQDKNFYFAGDTAYGQHFKEIAQRFPSIDIALMPIGPTEEGENTHKLFHVDAPEAIDAFIDLDAHCFVPMHYGTFFSGKNTLDYPINKLHSYWQEKQDVLSTKKLLFARCGKQYAVL